MKVLLFVSPGSVSGACLSMLTLSEKLDRMGVDTVLVVKSKTKQILENKGKNCYVVCARGWTVSLEWSRIKICIMRIATAIWNIIPYIQIKKIIKKEKPDIVHMDVATSYIGAKAAFKCKRKTVWHIRELLEEDLGVRWINPAKALKLMSKADHLVSISRCVYDKFHALMPKIPHQVVYNGIDIEYYGNTAHEIFDNKTVVFTIAGRIEKNKGQFEALEALTNILKTVPNAELWIVGNESKGNKNIENLKAYMRENKIAEDKVKFWGFVDVMPSVWEKTDVAIVASKCEAFGRVTVEAMASGCLVLGANTGATPELIKDGETGILYQQGNAKDLERKARHILENKCAMKKIAATGREFAVNNFTAEKNASEIKAIYDRVLNEG